jgi:Tfp pilus assembly protein PilN
VRAVNLIPADERRGAGLDGGSGALTYALLGALAVLLLMALTYTLAGKAIDDRRSELADVRAQADAAQAKADELRAYTRFSELRAKRVQTVTSLAASRFDWAHTMHEIARVIPANAWLTGLKGSVTGEGSTGGTAAATSAPSVQITGCTTSQQSVARMMARMRLVDGVQRVSLHSSEKGGGSCGTSDRFPAFELVVFFRSPTAIQGASR